MPAKIEDGLTNCERNRLKDLDKYRKRKREWAKTPSQRKYRREYMRKWREKNRKHFNELCLKSHRKNYHKHKDKRRAYALMVNYGLTVEAFNEMKLVQENKCLICSKNFDELKKQPHVDHDHLTGEIRGILCGSCNTKLGWYEAYSNKIKLYLEE